MVQMSETELLQKFRNERSEQAFGELVRHYAGLVYSVAKRRLPNASLAEDVTQIVFIRLAKNPPVVRTPGELAAWLHRITLNVTIDTWRSETRRRNREQQAMAMEPDTTHHVWEEISPNLDEALNKLNDEDREAILLRFFETRTMREVGLVMGVSEAAAKMRVGRAVDRLRTQLGAATACSAVIFATLLTERSAGAAPTQLVSQIVKMKLPAAAGKGALLRSLSRVPGIKLVAGAVVSVLVVITGAHFLHSNAETQTPQTSQAASSGAAVPPPDDTHIDLAQAEPSPIVISNAAGIQLHVVDSETGVGLSGTRIRYDFSGSDGLREGRDTFTDEKGFVAIPRPTNKTMISATIISATAEAHVPKSLRWIGEQAPAEYTVKLDPAVTASGFIVDEQGKPVPDVRISVPTPAMVLGQIENIDFWTCPVTNRDDASWSFSYIPKDTNEFSFVLDKPGYAQTCVPVPMDRVELNNLILVINHGTVIEGKIADQRGQPIANCHVKVLSGDRDKRLSANTDENGVFELVGVMTDPSDGYSYDNPPIETNRYGSTILRGLRPHGAPVAYLAVQIDGYAPQMKAVELSGLTNSVSFTLAPGNILRGRVVDESGAPIPDALVQTDFCFKRTNDREFDWTNHTDSGGWFQWDSAPSEEVGYWITAAGYNQLRNAKFLADGGEHDVVLKGGKTGLGE